MVSDNVHGMFTGKIKEVWCALAFGAVFIKIVAQTSALAA